ncbi:hypothetical protein NDU88_005944 [Pleurodeles waltl]|uniref:Uncharacterized protein n=1 Tax=Pleurodeles waltl TaxID=8319 RepID=A0AAV7RNR1_PLEWA|nr:hypothetical protein NDU88_005944 [Pleurodeles waltl]
MPSSTGSGGGIGPCDADLWEGKVTVSHLGVTPTGFAGARTHYSPWRQDYTLSTGSDGCSVVELEGLVLVLAVLGGGSSPYAAASDTCPLGLLEVLAVVGGGSCPSPVASDGCPLELLVVLAVVGGGSCPSPAASDGCPLGLLLLAVVQVAVLMAVMVLVLPVVGGGSCPSPEASDGCPLGLLLLAVGLVMVQVAVLMAVQVAVLMAVLVAVLPVGGEVPALPLKPPMEVAPWLVLWAQILSQHQASCPSCLQGQALCPCPCRVVVPPCHLVVPPCTCCVVVPPCPCRVVVPPCPWRLVVSLGPCRLVVPPSLAIWWCLLAM